jgi:hypothetical protein
MNTQQKACGVNQCLKRVKKGSEVVLESSLAFF